MLKPDAKRIAGLLLLGKAKPAESESQDDDSEGSPEPLEAAAQDVLDAVKAGSASDLAEALKSFCQLCDED